MQNLKEIIFDVVSDQLGVSRQTLSVDNAFVADLGADSLDLIELVMAIEDRLGREIPDEEAAKLSTLYDALNYLDPVAYPLHRPLPSAARVTDEELQAVHAAGFTSVGDLLIAYQHQAQRLALTDNAARALRRATQLLERVNETSAPRQH